MPGNFESFARALEQHYGLTKEQVSFLDVHELADRDHSDVGDHVLSHAQMTDQERARITAAAERSVDLWWQFFDGMERAAGV